MNALGIWSRFAISAVYAIGLVFVGFSLSGLVAATKAAGVKTTVGKPGVLETEELLESIRTANEAWLNRSGKAWHWTVEYTVESRRRSTGSNRYEEYLPSVRVAGLYDRGIEFPSYAERALYHPSKLIHVYEKSGSDDIAVRFEVYPPLDIYGNGFPAVLKSTIRDSVLGNIAMALAGLPMAVDVIVDLRTYLVKGELYWYGDRLPLGGSRLGALANTGADPLEFVKQGGWWDAGGIRYFYDGSDITPEKATFFASESESLETVDLPESPLDYWKTHVEQDWTPGKRTHGTWLFRTINGAIVAYRFEAPDRDADGTPDVVVELKDVRVSRFLDPEREKRLKLRLKYLGWN